MNLLDPKALDASLDALQSMLDKQRETVQITLHVPISALDLSGCTIERYTDKVEFWGGRFPHTVTDVDLTPATFAGYPVTISGDCEDSVIDYLLERDSE